MPTPAFSVEEIVPSYDEAALPFPNDDEFFLGTLLDLKVNPDTHISHVGSVDELVRLRLFYGCIEKMLPSMCRFAKYTADTEWPANAKDKNLHPNGGSVTHCVAQWDSVGVRSEKDFLKALIPNHNAIDALDLTYLTCDFVGFHDDVQLAEEKNRGVLAILLNAPYGCQIVTNGTHITQAEVGGVYLMDDLSEHAVFPTRVMPESEINGLTGDAEHVKRYVNETAMSFALYTYYY